MIQAGKYQSLEILRQTNPGLYLGDGEGNEVLLPNKYIPASFQIGGRIDVFVYLDSDDRLVATTIKPYITLGGFGLLKVKDVSKQGAFLDWGLEKDLFVPFSEQLENMRPGQSYLVCLYQDHASGRLAASSKLRKFLDNTTVELAEGEEVDIIIGEASDLGANVIVNGRHAGLVYHDEIFANLEYGQQMKGYVKKIRTDNKLDIALQKPGYAHVEPNAQKILEILGRQGGFLPLHDNSDPSEISELLGMSKKTFKKALGALYRQRLVTLHQDGVRLA